MSRRGLKRLAKRTGLALAALAVLLVGYGVAVEPRFILDERRVSAPLPRLDDQFEGAEVAFLTDPQLGMWLGNRGMAERAVERVVSEQPDAVLLGGDFLYRASEPFEEDVESIVELLAPLVEAELPTYAVLGNHDYASGAAEVLTARLEDLGIDVLSNDAVPIAGLDSATPLYVVGLAATRPGLTDVDAALDDVPTEAPRLVLMHNPTAFPEMPARSAPFAVAGHTHCGQVAFPGTPRWSYVALTEEEAMVADGFAFETYGQRGNRLFVSCGIGMSLLPIRINAPPQVVFIDVHPAGRGSED